MHRSAPVSNICHIYAGSARITCVLLYNVSYWTKRELILHRPRLRSVRHAYIGVVNVSSAVVIDNTSGYVQPFLVGENGFYIWLTKGRTFFRGYALNHALRFMLLKYRYSKLLLSFGDAV